MIEKRKFRTDEKGFTGLEAAIVLTAFVVVAAVFSYVVLNAGFFTTQKTQEVIHTGVGQATSSVQLAGDVVGRGNTNTNEYTNITLTLALTAGKSPVDLKTNRTIVSYTDPNQYVGNTSVTLSWVGEQLTADTVLESGEKAELTINLTADADDETGTKLKTALKKNTRFTIEVKPPEGATLAVERLTPGAVDAVVNLH